MLALAGFLIGPDPMPAVWRDPGYNRIVWIQGPHCDQREGGAVVDTIVLHATVNPSAESTTRWFMNPESRVSAHFTVGKDGSIIQHVSTFDRAWHAGVSRDAEGRERVNNFSIGIEIVNLNDGKDPYTEAQYQVVDNLIGMLTRRFPIRTIVSHAFIAQPKGRKSDPLGFDWNRLRHWEPKVKLIP